MSINLSSERTIFVLVFIWCILAGSALQLLILPFLVPHLHAGDGLLSGGDWVSFHSAALRLHRIMLTSGWQEWELRPAGQAPVGIAAAAYYLTGYAKPIVLLPLNAAFFALSATLFYGVLLRSTGYRLAWIGLLPFVCFPSALLIYGQFHKDIFSISGIAILLYVLSVSSANVIDYRFAAMTLLMTTLGLLLLLLVRPYLVDIAILSWWIGFAVMRSMMVRAQSHLTAHWRLVVLMALVLGIQLIAHDLSKRSMASDATTGSLASYETGAAPIGVCYRTAKVDRIICSINETRRLLTAGYPHATSAIDSEVRFESLQGMIMYCPRALQIGLLAPFPDMWFSSGTNPGSRLMRIASGVEMSIAYIAISCLFIVLLMRLLWSVELFGITSVSLCFIVIFALAIPNIGTLYRMRYAPWSLVIGFGVIAAATLYENMNRIKLDACVRYRKKSTS